MSEPISDELVARVEALLAAQRASLPSERVPAPAYSPLHETAAVLAWFDPESIRPADGAAAPEFMDELLADSVQAVAPDGGRRWMLTAEVRIATLRQLRESGRLRGALAVRPEWPNDPLQGALTGYLRAKAPPLEEQSLEALAASSRVCEWLRTAGFEGLPEADAIKRRTEWLTLLQPFEHLAGEHFRGRARELQQLRSYAGVLPPGSVLEAASRLVEGVLSLNRKPPLVIHGPGGVGKSTLIARFLLEHARAHEGERFPFAYLDFDRPDVTAQEPLTLLIEAVRQLGIEYPQARASCEHIRQGWLESLAAGQQHLVIEGRWLKGSPGLLRTRSASVRDFASLIESLGADDRPVLFILDTFEEVQYRSAENVAAVWRLLEELQQAVPRLRVVVAGRANLPEQRAEELVLAGLDPEAAVGYLQARGISDLEVARRLARQVGGSPLSLKLAAELAALEGLDKSGKLDLATREFFLLRVDDALIQRQLYRRVLGHIHDENVRKLAHPGLVLRRLTPELILEVLAEPCGLKISSLYDAQEIFQEFRREVSLVTEASDGALVHRPDLRRLMLELLQADEPERTREIHQRTVRYYERQTPEPLERAEEIYHRLLLGQEPATIDARWIDGVESHLTSALPELSGARRAYLASRLGVEVDRETERLADLEDWERIVERKVRDLLAQEQPGLALELLEERAERTPTSPLCNLHATALARLERWSESLTVLDRGIESAVVAGQRRPTLALALQAAEVVLASGRASEALPALKRLERLAEGSLSPADRLETVVRRLALARLNPALLAQGPNLERELRETFDALPDDVLATRPTLACWAGSVFHREDVRRLARVLRLTGLPRASETVLRQLAAELASFDAAISRDRGEAQGALARQVDVPVRSSLTAAWTDFLLKASDSLIRDSLAILLEQQASAVPPRLIEGFARALRSALGIERAPAVDSAEPLTAQRQRTRGSSLSASLRADLLEALIEVFPSVDALRQFLLLRLERSLDTLTLRDDLQTAVFRLVETAERQGWLVQLVVKAREAQPANVVLAEIAERLGISTLSLGASVVAASTGSFLDPSTWRERLGAIEAQVCRVEVGGSFGTGFLVGVDLLLTADFVLTPVYDGRVAPGEVRLRFDYKADQRSRTISAGTVFELESDWLVARSEIDPRPGGPDGLGYALLRVRHSPGAQPIGGSSAEELATLRQWIEVMDPPPAVHPGEGLVIVQHLQGGPLKLEFNRNGVVGLSEDGRRIYYELNTVAGSSGSPCFTLDFNLIAFHIGSSRVNAAAPPKSNVGVLVAAVLDDLRSRGMEDLLSARFV